jgi:hypothetical protein
MMPAVLLFSLLLCSVSAAAQPRVVNVARDLDQVATDLDGLVRSNAGTPLAGKVEDSAAKVRSAVTKLRQTPPDRHAGLGDLEGAAGDLEAAVKEKLLRAPGDRLLNRITDAARQLALDAIAQAGRNRPNSARAAEATVSSGDRERNASRYKDAIARYRDALSRAGV